MRSDILNQSSGSYQEYINQNVTLHTGTGALDATSIDADHKIITSGVLAAAITLPQATAANAGMVIDICVTAAVAADGTCLIGFANAGSTVFVGSLITSISLSTSAKEATGTSVTTNAKRLVLDSNNVNTAGGGIGSWYRCIYTKANQVFVFGMGIVTGTTATDPTAACSTTDGVDA